jgi:hypothetical protein
MQVSHCGKTGRKGLNTKIEFYVHCTQNPKPFHVRWRNSSSSRYVTNSEPIEKILKKCYVNENYPF